MQMLKVILISLSHDFYFVILSIIYIFYIQKISYLEIGNYYINFLHFDVNFKIFLL